MKIILPKPKRKKPIVQPCLEGCGHNVNLNYHPVCRKCRRKLARSLAKLEYKKRREENKKRHAEQRTTQID